MQKIIENKLYSTVLIIILSVSLLLVVSLGRIKQKTESDKWKSVANKIEMDEQNKSSDSTSKDVQSNKEALVEEEAGTSTKTYTYTGANVVGTEDSNRWKNKNWYVIGDNITAWNGYQTKVKSALNMAKVTTDAAIGKVMGDMAVNLNSDKLKNIDLVTVFAGTADYSLNVPLGTKSDDENTNSFYGNVHKTINKIIASNPDTTILFFTPLKRGAYKNYPVYPNPNNAGVTLEDYVQAIKEVCKEYNILVYDLFNESGINESNLKSYTIDNLNLNGTGYIRISTLISNYLKTVK